MPVEEIEIKTSYGKLSAVLDTDFEGEFKGTAIVMHGRKSKKERPSYVDISEIAKRNGFQVIRFDFRGHGQSAGSPDWMKFGLLDHVDDIKNVIDYFQSKNILKKQLVLVPTSFCADVSLIYAAQNNLVDTVVLVSPGLGKKSSGTEDNHYRRDWWNDNISATQIPFSDYKRLLESLKMPIFSIHGKIDETAPIEQSRELQELIGQNFKLYEIEEGQHNYMESAKALKERQKILHVIFGGL